MQICKFSSALGAALLVGSFLVPTPARGQVYNFTKQDLIDYTPQNPFERFPDGRPKVPEKFLKRAQELSLEEIWRVLPEKGYPNQFADGFQMTHAEKKIVGRVFTAQFMPVRPDIDKVAVGKAKERGLPDLRNQTVIDMLQPGDVLVVDLFGKKVNGTMVGDNLFYYIYKTTHGAGLIIDGAIRDLDGISEIDMPALFRYTDPTPIGNVMLTGINVPVRLGNATVMPGDLAVGTKEGVYFVPPQLVEQILDGADEIHVHDEWTKKKFDEGKYKSAEIYGSPKDPALKQEYADYLKKRLAEIRAAQ